MINIFISINKIQCYMFNSMFLRNKEVFRRSMSELLSPSNSDSEEKILSRILQEINDMTSSLRRRRLAYHHGRAHKYKIYEMDKQT